MDLKNIIFKRSGFSGFTVIELIVVCVIISITALIAIPMIGSAASDQAGSAANILAADIEYAKNLAISRQQNYYVVFDTTNNSYEVQDKDRNVISHPVNSGKDFVVKFDEDNRLGRVKIKTVDFDSSDTVFFDYLGSPYNGFSNPLNSGSVILEAGEYSLTISIEPVTGYITIN